MCGKEGIQVKGSTMNEGGRQVTGRGHRTCSLRDHGNDFDFYCVKIGSHGGFETEESLDPDYIILSP